MATKWYLRNTTPATTPTAGEKSTTEPVAASNYGGSPTTRAFSTTKGDTATSATTATNATTAAQNGCLGRWCTGPLVAGTYGSGNWTFAIQSSESNADANAFFVQGSIYFWRPSNNTVVGFVKDTDTAVGVEFGNNTTSRYGQVLTIAGNNVTIQDGDILVFEVWVKATQGMNSSRNLILYYDGTTDVTAAYSGTDPASYFSPPANVPELVNVDAGVAEATDTAYNASISISEPVGVSSGSGQAHDATVETATPTNVFPDPANGTGESLSASTDIKPTGNVASATGESTTAPVSISVYAIIAEATGAGYGIGPDLKAETGVAQATGTAQSSSASVSPSAAVATATSAGFEPSIAILINATASTGTGSAIDAGVESAGSTGPSITEVTDASSTTSTATLQFSVVGSFSAGDYGFVLIGADNAGTAGVSSVTSVADSQGNTWQEALVNNYTPGASANDGVTLSVWKSQIATPLGGADTITVSFSPNTTSKAAKLYKLRNVSGTIYASATATGQGDS